MYLSTRYFLIFFFMFYLGGPGARNILWPPPPELFRCQGFFSSLFEEEEEEEDEEVPGGAGPSPNSAIKDIYSSSIAFLEPPEFHSPVFLPIQSLAIWPAPPQVVQTTLFVTLGLSSHCQAL